MTDYNWPIITENTPLSEIKEIHRRIWDYVIERGEKPKTPYMNDCVLCEYDAHFKDDCTHCPSIEACKYYNRWCLSTSDVEKRLLAKKVRDIEFEEGDDV